MNGLTFLFFAVIAFLLFLPDKQPQAKFTRRQLHKTVQKYDSTLEFDDRLEKITQYLIVGLIGGLSIIGGVLRFITGFFPKGHFPYPTDIILSYLFDST